MRIKSYMGKKEKEREINGEVLSLLLIMAMLVCFDSNLKPNNILVGKDELKLTDVNLFRNKKCILSLYSAPELLL